MAAGSGVRLVARRRNRVAVGSRAIPLPEPGRQRPLRQQTHGVRPAPPRPPSRVGLGRGWRVRPMMGLAPEERVRRRLHRPHQHGPGLRLEPPPHHVHPLAVHEDREGAGAVAGPLGGQLPLARQPPPRAHRPLQLRGRSGARELEQLRLALGRRDAGERAHLGVGDASAPQGLRGLRQTLERPRRADPLARRSDLDAGPPREPLGAGSEAVPPAAAPVEVGDEGHHPHLRGVDARGELGDALAQLEELVGVPGGVGAGCGLGVNGCGIGGCGFRGLGVGGCRCGGRGLGGCKLGLGGCPICGFGLGGHGIGGRGRDGCGVGGNGPGGRGLAGHGRAGIGLDGCGFGGHEVGGRRRGGRGLGGGSGVGRSPRRRGLPRRGPPRVVEQVGMGDHEFLQREMVQLVTYKYNATRNGLPCCPPRVVAGSGGRRRRMPPANASSASVSPANGRENTGSRTASVGGSQIRQWRNGTTACEFGTLLPAPPALRPSADQTRPAAVRRRGREPINGEMGRPHVNSGRTVNGHRKCQGLGHGKCQGPSAAPRRERRDRSGYDTSTSEELRW